MALPAHNLRLDRPLLPSRVSRFAPINANCAPLTARTARRLAPPGRAFAFNAPLSAVPLRSKKTKPTKGVFPMQQISKQPAFELGQIVATPGALAALKKAGQQPGEFLTRHVNREWGDLSDEDRKENEYSLEHGFRLLSAYRTHTGDKLWIITESDRSVTTLCRICKLFLAMQCSRWGLVL